MKFKAKINSAFCILHSALILGLAALGGLAIAGCVTSPIVHPEKPIEVVVFVQADKPRWQDSGIIVRRGEIVHCIAEGKWSDLNGTYGPEGNPEVLKDHLGLSAPANALLMKIDYHTNLYLSAQICPVGKETNVMAQGSGHLLFANNVSLPLGMRGELKVTVTVSPDADGDGLSDYEEMNVWKTDPLNADSDGDGFRDGQEVSEQKIRERDNFIRPRSDRH